MSEQHTPGRLSLEEVENDTGHIKHQCLVDSEVMSMLTIVEHQGSIFAAVYKDADARRLAACWNACDGMKTQQVEQISQQGDTLASRLALHVETEAELISQRDELLKLLRLARTQLDDNLQELTSCHTSPATGLVDEAEVLLAIESEQDLINQIDAAIAKSGGAA